jgi:hypothetical protein
MTRTIPLLLLPLLAAGAVVPSTQQATPIVEYPQVIHQPSLERRQLKEVLGKGLQNNLPKFFQWAADNLSYLLRVQDLPLKRSQGKPVLNHAAKRVALRYGPWLLHGTNVRNCVLRISRISC